MNYEQEEQVKKLTYFINSNTKDGFFNRIDKLAMEADLTWNASRFWANVMHKAEPLQYECEHKDFLKFKSIYETQNNMVVNSDRLFSEFWLRNVLGFIEIPGAISSACYRFEIIKANKDELKFLCEFYLTISGNKNNIALSVFQKALD
jgi:hypothetical protein